MDKFLLFEETANQALEEISKQEEKIRKGEMHPQSFQEPILYAIRNYIDLPEVASEAGKPQPEVPHDVIFHLELREKPWKLITPVKHKELVIAPIPIVLTEGIFGTKISDLAAHANKICSENPYCKLFATKTSEPKIRQDPYAPGKEIRISPSLSFYKGERDAKQNKLLRLERIEEYPFIEEKIFFETYFEHPHPAKQYFDMLRKKVNASHYAPRDYN